MLGCLFGIAVIICVALLEIGILAFLGTIVCWAFGLTFSWKIILGVWAVLVICNMFLVPKGGSK